MNGGATGLEPDRENRSDIDLAARRVELVEEAVERVRQAEGDERLAALEHLVYVTRDTARALESGSLIPLSLKQGLEEMGTQFAITVRQLLAELHPRLVRLPGTVMRGGAETFGAGDLERATDQALGRLGELERLAGLVDRVLSGRVGIRLAEQAVETSVSDFRNTVYEDYFEANEVELPEEPGVDRRFPFDYFDPDNQGERREIRGSVRDLFSKPVDQIELLEEVYSGHLSVVGRGAGRVDVFDDSDLRWFVTKRYERRRPPEGQSPLRALRDVVGFLQRYLDAFTVATHYDAIDPTADPDRNYLTRAYPRTLTGQRIHDCAVYAMRMAYLLTPIARREGWTLRFLRLPYHLDVVLERPSEDGETPERLPLLFNHSGKLNGDSRLFDQEDTALTTGDDRSGRIADLYGQWASADDTDGSLDQFVGELVVSAANVTRIPRRDGEVPVGVLTPFRLADAGPPPRDGPPVVDWLWDRLQSDDVSAPLFTPPGERPDFDEFPGNYLQHIDLRRQFYNRYVYDFWNVDDEIMRLLLVGEDERDARSGTAGTEATASDARRRARTRERARRTLRLSALADPAQRYLRHNEFLGLEPSESLALYREVLSRDYDAVVVDEHEALLDRLMASVNPTLADDQDRATVLRDGVAVAVPGRMPVLWNWAKLFAAYFETVRNATSPDGVLDVEKPYLPYDY